MRIAGHSLVAVLGSLAGGPALAHNRDDPKTIEHFSGAEGYFSARMKMGKTSDVKVYVKSGGKLHMASQQIKVTVGGCGG